MYDRQMINGLTASLRREVSTHLLSLSVLRISIFLEPGMSFQHGHKGVRLLEYQLRLLPLLIPVVFGSREIILNKTMRKEELLFAHKGQVQAVADLALSHEPGDT